MYGNFKQNVLNTTLFLSNVSDVSYVCLDALENLYVYSQYKFKLFGFDWTNLLLGGLQNALKAIIPLTKIIPRIEEYEKDPAMERYIYYEIGKITEMILEFDPVILEESGLDDDVYL